jgi:hypothetical protein
MPCQYKLREKRSYKKKQTKTICKKKVADKKFICGWDMREDKTIGQP